MLRILADNERKANTRVAAQSAITGATPEQVLAGQESNRRTYADAVADIASNASQIRDQYLRDYNNQRNNYYAQRLGIQDTLSAIHQNQANQWANAAGNAMQAGATMLANGMGKETGVASKSAEKKSAEPKQSAKPAGVTLLEEPEDYLQPAKPPVVESVDASLVTKDLRKKLGFK